MIVSDAKRDVIRCFAVNLFHAAREKGSHTVEIDHRRSSGGCSGGTLDFNFFVENGLAEFLKPSQWLRTTYEAPYQRYE
jgi:hypothetical protein